MSGAIDATAARLLNELPPLLVSVVHASGTATAKLLVKALRAAIGNGNNQYKHDNATKGMDDEHKAQYERGFNHGQTGYGFQKATAGRKGSSKHAAYRKGYDDGVDASGDRRMEQNELRTADKTGFKFDVTNPKATAWASQHAADLVTGISQTTRDDIKSLVEGAFEEQVSVDDLADAIDLALGGDPARAEVIARTETMRAANEGQLEAWDQATEDGLLTGNEQKEWIVTPDDRLCPICEDLDGVTIPMDEDFDADGDQVDGPPAHPNCRCTLGLSL